MRKGAATETKKRENNYWEKRFQAKADRSYKELGVFEKELQLQYEKALESIQNDLIGSITRYGKKNKLDYVEVVKRLNHKELLAQKSKIEAYTQKVIQGESKLLEELNTLAAKTNLNRLDGLMADIIGKLSEIEAYLNTGLKDNLKDTFVRDYYETIFEVQKGTGIATSFSKVPDKLVEDTLKYPWSGKHFSESIWGNSQKLANTLKVELAQGFIRGDSMQQMANRVAKQMDKGYKEALRVVRTETTFICNKSTIEGYKATYVTHYIFLATLDGRTSSLCRDKDGKHFDVEEAMTGVNLPPLHAWCRSTTIPDVGEGYGERVAKASNGEIQEVPFNTTYKEWYNKSTNKIEEEKKKELAIDNKQFGKKIGKHAKDYGLDLKDPNTRDILRSIIKTIYTKPDEIREGMWEGQGAVEENGRKGMGKVEFYIKDNDVVVTKKGEFITILKDGKINTEKVKQAKRIDKEE